MTVLQKYRLSKTPQIEIYIYTFDNISLL
jgi:hypothetical protein